MDGPFGTPRIKWPLTKRASTYFSDIRFHSSLPFDLFSIVVFHFFLAILIHSCSLSIRRRKLCFFTSLHLFSVHKTLIKHKNNENLTRRKSENVILLFIFKMTFNRRSKGWSGSVGWSGGWSSFNDSNDH